MAEHGWRIASSSDRHRCPVSRRPCLYETTLRQAIASQHGIGADDRMELFACGGCGAPYLVQDVWQPFRGEGEIACPRCGTTVVTWEGSRSVVTYWLKGG